MTFHYRKLVYLSFCMGVVILTSACRGNPEGEEKVFKNYQFITAQSLVGVSSPDPDHIWIVGFNSTILHSGDGGKSWLNQKCALETDLYDVFFLDSMHGWAVGKYGIVLRTTDGGGNWIKVKTPTDERLFDVFFVDVKTGWAVGSWGIILHTEDGGQTWEKQGSGEDRIYNGVWFTDAQRGWIVGEYGVIVHTRDGGKEWVKQECKDIIPILRPEEWETKPPSLYGVYFQTPSKGWAVGIDGLLLATEDGGNHWKKLQSPAQFTLYKITVIGNEGWAVGSRGGYVFSTDGGKSWSSDEGKIKTRFWLRDLAFSDSLHGWAVGSRGTIIATQDGGKTWSMVSGISIG